MINILTIIGAKWNFLQFLKCRSRTTNLFISVFCGRAFRAKTCLAGEKLKLNKFHDGVRELLWATVYATCLSRHVHDNGILRSRCNPSPARHFPLSYDLCSLVAVSTGYWLKYTHSGGPGVHTDLCTHRPAGVCDIVVPCKSTPVPRSSPPCCPDARRSVDRVERVKSTRHASRSNRLTGGTVYTLIWTRATRSYPPSRCIGVHIDGLEPICRRRASTHIHREHTWP